MALLLVAVSEIGPEDTVVTIGINRRDHIEGQLEVVWRCSWVTRIIRHDRNHGESCFLSSWTKPN